MDDNSPSLGGDRQESSDHLNGNEPKLEGVLSKLELRELILKMDDRQRRLFACDCAEHVLHIFEVILPHDKRPHEAVAVARRYAVDKATNKELGDARMEALSGAGALYDQAGGRAAKAVYYAASRTHENFIRFHGGWTQPSFYLIEVSFHVADYAALSALGAAVKSVPEQAADSTEESERNWQKQRAVWYLTNQDASASDDDIE